MSLALLLLLFQDPAPELTVSFQSMHCEECKIELGAVARKLPGVGAARIAGTSLILTLTAKAPVPPLNRFPKDLKVRAATLTVSGTAVFAGKKVNFVARGSGATYALVNPPRPAPDRLAELRSQKWAKNRFRVTGILSGPKVLLLASFRKTDWR